MFGRIPLEAIGPWTLVFWKVFDYCFNFVAGYWIFQIVYFSLFWAW